MTTPAVELERIHYHAHMGPPAAAHEEDVGGTEALIEAYEDAPVDGATTLITRGLADFGHGPEQVPLNQELLVSVWTRSLDEDLLRVFGAVADSFVGGHDPLLRGDVVRLNRALVRGSPLAHLYVCQPTHFERSFAEIERTGGEPIRLRWLIPVHRSEASWRRGHGANAFEDLFVDQQPDLLDPYRAPLRLPHGFRFT